MVRGDDPRDGPGAVATRLVLLTIAGVTSLAWIMVNIVRVAKWMLS